MGEIFDQKKVGNLPIFDSIKLEKKTVFILSNPKQVEDFFYKFINFFSVFFGASLGACSPKTLFPSKEIGTF